MSRRRLATLALALALLPAACGDGNSDEGQIIPQGGGEAAEEGGGGAPAQGLVAMAVTEQGFEPREVSVRVGQAVNFTNRGDAPHTVVAQAPAAFSRELAPGATATFRPDAEGRIEVRVRGLSRATGVIVVSDN